MKSEFSHTKLSDYEFSQQFEKCTLDPAVFNHEAHVRLAWIQINNNGLEKAIENIQRQLQQFVNHVGANDKYHRTLTIAAIQAVNHFIKQSNSSNFKDFIKEFPELKYDFKNLINSHYSFDIFKSLKAKSEYLEPDLVPYK